MKRIGILTYHKSENYGAFMQCYSLTKKLQKLFPDETIEVVDYISKEVYCIYHPSVMNFIYLIIYVKSIRKKIRYSRLLLSFLKQLLFKHTSSVNHYYFDEAQQYLPLSRKQIITDNYKKVVHFLNENYDIIIVGSDAVWNWQIRPFPNVYFLGPQITTKKLSYAASSYGQPFLSLSDNVKSEIKFGWESFNYIGVRDIPTENFVSIITDAIIPKHNCDPTVFLDISKLPIDKQLVLGKLQSAGFDVNRKSICIMAQPWLASFVRLQLGDEYQIISVFKYSKYADVNLLDINPFEWAVCFSFFDITITHYFHGNLLSLKNGTPTIVIEQKSEYNQRYESKIRDFMKRINCFDYCHYLEDLPNDYSLRDEIETITNDKTFRARLSEAIEKEADSFNSFKYALSSIINETN